MMHRCPDGHDTRLTRHGPVGTTAGVWFTCPRCGYSRTGEAILADVERVRPLLVQALRGTDSDRRV